MLVYRAHNLTRERVVFLLALVPTAVSGAVLPGYTRAENLLSLVGGAYRFFRIGM